MHVCIYGISPHTLTIGAVETTELSLHSFIIENPEHGLGCPIILQDDRAGEQGIVLEMQEHAKIVQVAA